MSYKEVQGFEGELSPEQLSAIKAFQREQRLDSSEEGLQRLVNIALAGNATQPLAHEQGRKLGLMSRRSDPMTRVPPQPWALFDSPETGFAAWG